MQRGVGRAARGSDNGRTVLQSLPRDDFARQWPAPFKHPHNQTARPARNLRALGIDAGNHRHVRHRQAHRLGNHSHGVGCELSRTGADRRQAVSLDTGQRRAVDFAGHEAAHSLIGVQDSEGFSLKASG